jgi:hypothetical protein
MRRLRPCLLRLADVVLHDREAAALIPEVRRGLHGAGREALRGECRLLSATGRTVRAIIATEREPSDSTWAALLAEENVVLVSPGRMKIADL